MVQIREGTHLHLQKKKMFVVYDINQTGMYHQILRKFPNIKFCENLISVCRVFFLSSCVQTVTQTDGASLISAPRGSERAQSRIKINHIFTAVLPPTA
jgi:hypothetical protein